MCCYLHLVTIMVYLSTITTLTIKNTNNNNKKHPNPTHARPVAPTTADVGPGVGARAHCQGQPVAPTSGGACPCVVVQPHAQPVAARLAGVESDPVARTGSGPQATKRLLLPNGLTLQSPLGSGSFGRVFKCVLSGRELAVKIRVHRTLRAPGAAELRDQEIIILKRIALRGGHRSIIRLEAWRHTPDGRLFLFFENYAQDLHRFIVASGERNETLGVADMMHCTSALCSAVAHLHACFVVHRDLKPQNILVRREAASSDSRRSFAWRFVICDFGNSTIVAERPPPAVSQWRRQSSLAPDAPHSTVTRRVTTLWYAAPEMLIPCVPYSFPIDIWALGLTLAQVEYKSHVCPSSLDAADWEQLLEIWIFCHPPADAAAASGAGERLSSFEGRAKRELMRYTPAVGLSRHLARRVRGRVGRVYGARFGAFLSRLLQFNPSLRSSAQVLDDMCRHVCGNAAALPNVWIIG